MSGSTSSAAIVRRAPPARAASPSAAHSRRHLPDQIESTEEVTLAPSAMARGARRKRTLHAITLSEAPMALSPSTETARIFADGLIAAGLDKLPWSKSQKQWRDRVMFLRKAEGDNWPDLSDTALAAGRESWLVA